MGDKEDDASKGPQTLSGRRAQPQSRATVPADDADDKADDLRPVRSEEEAARIRVATGIEAGKAHRAKVLARSPIARLTGFKA